MSDAMMSETDFLSRMDDWATQVLEQLIKKGALSRGEMWDGKLLREMWPAPGTRCSVLCVTSR